MFDIAYDHCQNEVFYHIGRKYWGRGYASEAAAAVLEYGFGRLGLATIIGATHSDNAASRRVLTKIGLREVGVRAGLAEAFAAFNGEVLYSVTRQEYGTAG